MNVKGSIFVDLVKIIKSDKSGVYDTYLTNRDRDIIDHKIFPSSWYPFETYKRCLNAIFEVIAKKDPEAAKEWGRVTCKKVMTGVYTTVMKGCDPLTYLQKCETINKQFYDFGKTEITIEGKNQAIYKLSGFGADFIVFYYVSEGWVESGIELCGGKNIKSELVTKSWEGQPFTSIRFTWTQ